MSKVSEADVRDEVRAWLAANWDPEMSLVEWRSKLADMLLDVELAKSAAYCAAQAAAAGDPEWPALASLAKAAASETYLHTAVECIQIHGGIGFTWDNDTHLWFKRAKSSEILFGDANEHREKMMRHWAPQANV